MMGPAVMGFILLALGVFVCSHALELSLGRASRPGPGFVSFGLGSILIVLAVLYLRQTFRQKERGEGRGKEIRLSRTFLALGGLCLYAAVLPWLGYLITTLFFFAFWLMVIERRRWVLMLPLACLAGVAVYLFNVIFSVQLPAGILKGFLR
jgi:putative tricarboxylic transport membrane protein